MPDDEQSSAEVQDAIPRVYYTPGATPGRVWLAAIPGFRSGTPWRMVLATATYLSLLALVVGGIGVAAASPGGTTAVPVTASSSPSPANPDSGPVSNPQPAASTVVSPSPSPTPTPTPTPKPSPSPSPVPTPVVSTAPPPPSPPPTRNLCGAPANPWNYNFCGGSVIYNPAPDFCQYFNCIPSFSPETKGYVEECKDGAYTHSGGRSGSCSYRGGNLRPIYQ